MFAIIYSTTAEIQKELMNVRAAHFHKMAYISFNAALSL